MRVKLIYQGDGEWAAPIKAWGECEHPREYLRFDPRYSLPIACYCRACGEAYIHPLHGLSEEEQEAARVRSKKIWQLLNEDQG